MLVVFSAGSQTWSSFPTHRTYSGPEKFNYNILEKTHKYSVFELDEVAPLAPGSLRARQNPPFYAPNFTLM